MAVELVHNDPLKLKIINRNTKDEDIFMKMKNIEDKEVLHYFLNEKLKNIVINN